MLEVFIFSLNATLPVILCMFLGLFLRARGAVDDEFTGKLNNLIYSVFLQFHVFNSIYSIDFKSEFSPGFLLFAFVGVIVSIIFFTVIFRITMSDRRKTVAYAHICYRTNYLMFGIAVTQSMYGDAGARIAAMLVPVAVPFFNLAAISLIAYATAEGAMSVASLLKSMAVGIVKNPVFTTCLLGLSLGFGGVALPEWANSFVRTVAGAATPLCLLLLGAQVDWKILKSNAKEVVFLTIIRLIAVPLVIVPIAVWAGFRGPYLAALFVLFASPCANVTLIMSHRYNLYPKLTAQVVALTTIASGFTAFLGIMTMRYLQLI